MIRELRRASVKWWARNEALKKAFVRKVGLKFMYKCAKCGLEYTRKQVQADHIEPVIDPTKKDFTIDEFCSRLLVGVEGYQILCKSCHTDKTNAENLIREKVKGKKVKKDGTIKKSSKKSKKSRLGNRSD